MRIWSGEGANTATDLYWGYEANMWNQTGDVVIVENQDGDRVLEYEYGDRRSSENVSVAYDECTATVGGDGAGYDVVVETEYYSPDGHQTGEREREDVSLPVAVPSQNRIAIARPPVVTTVIATAVTVSDEDEVVTEAENPNLADCRAQIEAEWQDYRNGTGEPIADPDEIEDAVVIADMTIETDDPGDEHIVLENTADRPVDLSGWTVRDRDDGGLVAAGVLQAFEFPDDFLLDGGEQVTIWTGEGSDSETDRYWGVDRHIWHDDGDTIIVSSPDGAVTIEEPYRGGAPDTGETDDDSGAGSSLSITYEDCSTVTVDGGAADVTYEYEIATTFYVDDGIDTMIFEPDDQPSFTFDAAEHETGAVTDVVVDAVTVIDAGTGDEVTHRTHPDDEACSDTIAQQYDEWQDEEDASESAAEATGVETDEEDGDASETESEADADEDDADGDADGESDDGDRDDDAAAAGDAGDGDSDSDDDESEADSDADQNEEDADENEDGDADADSDEGEDDGDDSDDADSDSDADDSGSDDADTSSDEDQSEAESNAGDEDGENDGSEPADSTSADGAGD